MVKTIECQDNKIICYLTQTIQQSIIIDIYSPNTITPILIQSISIKVNGNSFELPRWYNEYDGCYLMYDHHLEGIKFVNKVNLTSTQIYPIYEDENTSKKGLRVVDINDGLSLNISHTVIDLPVQNLLRTFWEKEDDIEYIYQNRFYYISNSTVTELDNLISTYTKNGIHCTINLLVCVPVDKRMSIIVEHPEYDNQGIMSAINVTSFESCLYLEALCYYLAKRYTQSTMKIDGLILANEISIQGYWANAGQRTCKKYLFEYSRALRIAWQAGAQCWSKWRVYISLDHHWNKSLKFWHGPLSEFRAYPGRECLLNLDYWSQLEGNFNWNIAHHPYAIDLATPDYYNDLIDVNDELPDIISFKNLIVLVKFVCYTLSRWQGGFRKIILSEQGFSSNDDLGLEYVQATAYGRAFKEVMRFPEIEAFIYHSHVDNEGEEGSLRLGLRRSNDFTTTDNIKPIYYVFKHIEDITYDNKPLWTHF